MFSFITNIIAPLFGISIQKTPLRNKKRLSKNPINPSIFVIKKFRKVRRKKVLTATELLEKQQAKIILTQRLQELSQFHNLPYARSFIRDQKRKWGSCSRKIVRRRRELELPPSNNNNRKWELELSPALCNISLNRRLSLMPDYIRDYVILHELAHTKHMNHSKDFWNFLETICPERKEAEQWLKEHGMKYM